MSGTGRTIRAYAELSRLSNGPTVITNVMVGVALAGAGANASVNSVIEITIAMLLLYVAGMALNDLVDARLDTEERPERPIPSGRVSRRGALRFAIVCMGSAIGLMVRFGGAALALTIVLAATIVLYDLLHKRYAASVVLMGGCRALVYLATAAAIARPIDWAVAAPPAAALLLYIVLVTVIARVEAKTQSGRRIRLAMLLPLPVLLLFLFLPPAEFLLPLLCGCLLIVWLAVTSSTHLSRTPPHIGAAVQSWLAGICLVDAYVVALLDRPMLLLVCFAGFALTLFGHRFIMGT